MFHLTATMFKTMPSMDQVAKDNPDLMKEIAKAMAKNMGGNAASTASSFPAPASSSSRTNRDAGHARNQQPPPTVSGMSKEVQEDEPIPEMQPPSIDFLAQILPQQTGQPMLFTESLANVFTPSSEETRVVELVDPPRKTNAPRQTESQQSTDANVDKVRVSLD